jgi:hypothetical protein
LVSLISDIIDHPLPSSLRELSINMQNNDVVLRSLNRQLLIVTLNPVLCDKNLGFQEVLLNPLLNAFAYEAFREVIT